jgi:hypothetical protein
MRAGGSKDHTIIADAYSDPDAYSDSDPDANPDSDPDADSDANTDANTYPDTDANANTNTNTYSDPDTDANTYSDPDANADTDADVAHLGLHGRMVIDERGLGGNGFDLHGSRCRQPAIDVLLDTCG